MRIARFEWDEDNEEHVSSHGVDASEAEEVLRLGPYLRRGRRRTYLAYGPTADGRLLLVVLRLAATRGGSVARVITARDLTRREREACRRRRR